MNSGTASTSEMLAATLHVNARAPLIGEHSYGKGRTQRIMNMKDGATPARVHLARHNARL